MKQSDMLSDGSEMNIRLLLNIPTPVRFHKMKKSRLLSYQHSGLDLNLSLTNDPKTVPWAHLIGHPRYPEVGLYEGGYIYQREYGGQRPPESCMIHL